MLLCRRTNPKVLNSDSPIRAYGFGLGDGGGTGFGFGGSFGGRGGGG